MSEACVAGAIQPSEHILPPTPDSNNNGDNKVISGSTGSRLPAQGSDGTSPEGSPESAQMDSSSASSEQGDEDESGMYQCMYCGLQLASMPKLEAHEGECHEVESPLPAFPTPITPKEKSIKPPNMTPSLPLNNSNQQFNQQSFQQQGFTGNGQTTQFNGQFQQPTQAYQQSTGFQAPDSGITTYQNETASPPYQQDAPQENYPCTMCPLMFPTSALRDQHVQEHGSEEMYNDPPRAIREALTAEYWDSGNTSLTDLGPTNNALVPQIPPPPPPNQQSNQVSFNQAGTLPHQNQAPYSQNGLQNQPAYSQGGSQPPQHQTAYSQGGQVPYQQPGQQPPLNQHVYQQEDSQSSFTMSQQHAYNPDMIPPQDNNYMPYDQASNYDYNQQQNFSDSQPMQPYTQLEPSPDSVPRRKPGRPKGSKGKPKKEKIKKEKKKGRPRKSLPSSDSSWTGDDSSGASGDNSGEGEEEDDDAEERPFTCVTCGKKFKYHASWNVHKRIHTKERPLKCKVCPKRFGDPANFIRHMKIHVKHGEMYITKDGTYRPVEPESRPAGATFEFGEVASTYIKSFDFNFGCHKCGMGFMIKESMESHVERCDDVDVMCRKAREPKKKKKEKGKKANKRRRSPSPSDTEEDDDEMYADFDDDDEVEYVPPEKVATFKSDPSTTDNQLGQQTMMNNKQPQLPSMGALPLQASTPTPRPQPAPGKRGRGRPRKNPGSGTPYEPKKRPSKQQTLSQFIKPHMNNHPAPPVQMNQPQQNNMFQGGPLNPAMAMNQQPMLPMPQMQNMGTQQPGLQHNQQQQLPQQNQPPQARPMPPQQNQLPPPQHHPMAQQQNQQRPPPHVQQQVQLQKPPIQSNMQTQPPPPVPQPMFQPSAPPMQQFSNNQAPPNRAPKPLPSVNVFSTSIDNIRRRQSNGTMMESSGGTTNLSCSMCDAVFRNSDGLGHHEQMHVNNQTVMCKYCGTRFSFLASMKQHIQTEHRQVAASHGAPSPASSGMAQGPVPKKRGRPLKNPAAAKEKKQAKAGEKKRGRPPKIKKPDPVSSSDDALPKPSCMSDDMSSSDDCPDTDLDSDTPTNLGSHLDLELSQDGAFTEHSKPKKLKFNKSDSKGKLPTQGMPSKEDQVADGIKEKKKALMTESVVTLGDIDSVLSGGDISVKDGSARRGKMPKNMIKLPAAGDNIATTTDTEKCEKLKKPKPKKSSVPKKGVSFGDDDESSDSDAPDENTPIEGTVIPRPPPQSTQKSILGFLNKSNESNRQENQIQEPVAKEADNPAPTPSLPFKCASCGEGFKMPRLLRKHEVGSHPGAPVTSVAELERQMKKWCKTRK